MRIEFQKRLLYHSLFLLFCTAVQSQELTKTELKEILIELENRHEVRFSYRVQDVQQVWVSPIPDGLGLDQALIHIEQETGLRFTNLNKRYIAITAPRSQVYCGIIKDSSSGEVLSGATILTDDHSFFSVTGKDGKFEIDGFTPGTRLHIRFMGFEEKTIYLTGSPILCREIFLEPVIYSLQEAVVVNYLTSGISKRRDGSTIINTRRFGTLPGQTEPDILQTIEALPGVESVNETISNINIRGGTSDQNLVLFDDIRMYLTGHFFGLISAFNPNLIDEVLVVKNGSSPQYKEGVSGTIEIRSDDEISGDLSGGMGISLINADAFLKLPLSEKLEVHMAGRRSINDLVNTPTYDSYYSRTFQDSEIQYRGTDQYLHQSDFYYYDTSFKTLYDPNEDHKLRFSFKQIHNQLNYTEFNSSSEDIRKSDLEQRNTALGGTWKALWPKNISTQAIVYLSQYRLNAMNHTLDTDQQLLQGNEVLENGAKLKVSKILNPQVQLSGGYQFYEVGVTNTEDLNNPFYKSDIKNVLRNHALYAEGKFQGEAVYLKGGGRLNFLPKFNKILVEPRLSLNYRLGRSVAFKALAEMKSQTTSQIIDLQEDFLGVENRRWILADEQTYPVMQSRQVSAGFDYKRRGWYLDITGYYKEVDGISTSNQGFQDQFEFLRTSGGYTSRGFELLVNKKWKNAHTYVNYTFGHSNYSFDSLEPSSFPNNFDIRHSASLATNYAFRNFKFSLGGHVRSGKPYSPPQEEKETRREGNTWYVNYSDPNSKNLPVFFRMDLSASYTYHTRQSAVKVGVGILNILDRENVINRYYRVDETQKNSAVEINNKSLGFTPNISLRLIL